MRQQQTILVIKLQQSFILPFFFDCKKTYSLSLISENQNIIIDKTKLEKRNVIIDYSLLSIQFWATDFEYKKLKTCLIIELFNFELSSPPPKKSCPLITNPNEILAVPPTPKKLPQKIEYPSPIITQEIIHKTRKKLRAKNLIRNRSKAKNKTKKCVIYIHSVEEICVLNFFWVIFLLGVNVMRKQKQKQPYHVVCNNPKYPFYWWRLLWISFEIWITMNFSFYHQWFSFYSFTFKDKNLYSIFRYILYVCE